MIKQLILNKFQNINQNINLKKINKIMFNLLILFFTINIVNSVTNISTCEDIYLPGEYELTQDLIQNKQTCINILKSDITLDCKGFEINGNQNENNYFGIIIGDINDDKNENNITLKNCKISNFYKNDSKIRVENYGLITFKSINTKIENVTFTNLSGGIYSEQSVNINFTNINIENTKLAINLNTNANINLQDINLINNKYDIYKKDTENLMHSNILTNLIITPTSLHPFYELTKINNNSLTQSYQLEKQHNITILVKNTGLEKGNISANLTISNADSPYELIQTLPTEIELDSFEEKELIFYGITFPTNGNYKFEITTIDKDFMYNNSHLISHTIKIRSNDTVDLNVNINSLSGNLFSNKHKTYEKYNLTGTIYNYGNKNATTNLTMSYKPENCQNNNFTFTDFETKTYTIENFEQTTFSFDNFSITNESEVCFKVFANQTSDYNIIDNTDEREFDIFDLKPILSINNLIYEQDISSSKKYSKTKFNYTININNEGILGGNATVNLITINKNNNQELVCSENENSNEIIHNINITKFINSSESEDFTFENLQLNDTDNYEFQIKVSYIHELTTNLIEKLENYTLQDLKDHDYSTNLDTYDSYLTNKNYTLNLDLNNEGQKNGNITIKIHQNEEVYEEIIGEIENQIREINITLNAFSSETIEIQNISFTTVGKKDLLINIYNKETQELLESLDNQFYTIKENSSYLVTDNRVTLDNNVNSEEIMTETPYNIINTIENIGSARTNITTKFHLVDCSNKNIIISTETNKYQIEANSQENFIIGTIIFDEEKISKCYKTDTIYENTTIIGTYKQTFTSKSIIEQIGFEIKTYLTIKKDNIETKPIVNENYNYTFRVENFETDPKMTDISIYLPNISKSCKTEENNNMEIEGYITDPEVGYTLQETKLLTIDGNTQEEITFQINNTNIGTNCMKVIINNSYSENTTKYIPTKIYENKPDYYSHSDLKYTESRYLLIENKTTNISYSIYNKGVIDSNINFTLEILNETPNKNITINISNENSSFTTINGEILNITILKLDTENFLGIQDLIITYNGTTEIYTNDENIYRTTFIKLFKHKTNLHIKERKTYIGEKGFQNITKITYEIYEPIYTSVKENITPTDCNNKIEIEIPKFENLSKIYINTFIDTQNDSDYSNNLNSEIFTIVKEKGYSSFQMEIFFPELTKELTDKLISINNEYIEDSQKISSIIGEVGIRGTYENIGFDNLNTTLGIYYSYLGKLELKSNGPDELLFENYKLINLTNISNITIDFEGNNFSINISLNETEKIINQINISYKQFQTSENPNSNSYQNNIGNLSYRLAFEKEGFYLTLFKEEKVSEINFTNTEPNNVITSRINLSFLNQSKKGYHLITIKDKNNNSKNIISNLNPNTNDILSTEIFCLYDGLPTDANQNEIIDQCEKDIDGDGIEDTEERKIPGNIIGTHKTIVSNQNLSIIVGNITNPTNKTFTNQTKIKLTEDKLNKTLVEFYFNFTNQSLDLLKIELDFNKTSENKSYGIVKGINVTNNQTKTIIIDKLSDTNQICLKDEELDSIIQISEDCDKENEYILSCDGIKVGNYTCTLTDNQFIVNGLTHSGVIEFVEETQSPETNETEETPSSGNSNNNNDDDNEDEDDEDEDDEPTITEKSNIISTPKASFILSYDIYVAGVKGFNNKYSGKKQVTMKSKTTDKEVVEFTHDFSSTGLDITNLEIEEGKVGSNNFVIVKGLKLNTTKTIRLTIGNTKQNTICVKDSNIEKISEISDNCKGTNEIVLTCDGTQNGKYKCTTSSNQYIITGLTHSGAKEFTTTIQTTTTTENATNNQTSNNINTDNNKLSNTESEPETISMDLEDSGNNTVKYTVIGSILVIIIILAVIITLNKKPDENYNQNQTKIIDTKDYDQKIQNYILQYRNNYSLEELKNNLIKTGYDSSEIDKVIQSLNSNNTSTNQPQTTQVEAIQTQETTNTIQYPFNNITLTEKETEIYNYLIKNLKTHTLEEIYSNLLKNHSNETEMIDKIFNYHYQNYN